MLLKLTFYYLPIGFFFLASSLVAKAQIISSNEYDSLSAIVVDMEEENQLKTLLKLGKYQSEKNTVIGLELLNRAIIIAKRLDKPKEETEILRLQGLCFDHEKKYHKALNLYNLSLEKARSLGDSILVIKTLHNIAFSYYKQEDFETSIKYHLMNIKINELIQDKETLGYTYNHLGLVYNQLNEFEKAEVYFQKAIRIREEINHLEGLGYTYYNLSVSYRRRKDYDLSLEYIDKSSEIFLQLGDTLQYASALNTKGNIFLAKEEYSIAKELYRKALSLSYIKEDWELVIQEHLNLGLVEAEQGNLSSAEKEYLKALKIAQEREIKSDATWISIYDKLHRVSYFKGNYKDAFSHLGDFFTYREKLANKTSKERIADLENKYELEKKEADLALIKQEKALLEQEAKSTKQLFILIILILVLIALFSFYLNYITTQKNKQIKSQGEALKAANEELDRFVYTVAHDLKSPLHSVIGLVSLLRLEKLTPDIEEIITLQEKKLNGLSDFISELLMYTKLSKQKSTYQNINFNKLILEVLEKINRDSDLEKVKTEIVIPSNINIFSDYSRLNSIFLNLITNSIRYRNKYIDNAFVKVTANRIKDYLQIKVEDNGLGIREEDLDKVFDKFYRANDLVEGTGLGLAIVKENIIKLKGNIKVTSVINKGTCFNIHLPFNLENI